MKNKGKFGVYEVNDNSAPLWSHSYTRCSPGFETLGFFPFFPPSRIKNVICVVQPPTNSTLQVPVLC